MVTGVEAAGIILAILPLVVNQLDAYVQGLETIKTFRTKRYRRELESYLTRLGTQQAIFLNTLEHLLEDVTDSDDEVRDLIGNPVGTSWQDPVFQQRLRTRLGRDHDIYIKTMTILSGLLQNLSDKLGLDTDINTSRKTQWEDANTIEREVKKFKDIFSKSIYAELLSRIDGANGVLQTLTQQSFQREQARSRRRTSSKSLANHRKARTHARHLHNAVVKGRYWKCPCREKHVVNLRLDSRFTVDSDHSSSPPFRPTFRLALSSFNNSGSTGSFWQWQEIDTEPADALESKLSSAQASGLVVSSNPGVSVKKVQFAAVASALQSIPWPIAQPQHDFPAISDICSALCGIASDHRLPAPLGFICADSDANQRYNLYLIRNISKDMQTRTLEDLLASSQSRARPRNCHGRVVFNRRDRLFLATTLACSVLQLHGSWLKDQWRSRDIVFAEEEESKKAMLEYPYISSYVSKNEDGLRAPPLKRTVSSLIRSQVLFPLGLALVELSLGQTLASMREPEDHDVDDAVIDLKTASRLIGDVCCESGGRYGDVVKKCLFWHGSEDANLDNEDLQRAVFESIVSPLLEDYKDFEGKSRIYWSRRGLVFLAICLSANGRGRRVGGCRYRKVRIA